MRRRRLLLASTALSMTVGAACGKNQTHRPPPGNPKGAIYDTPDAEPLPMPGNPKGSRYDENVPVPIAVDAAAPDGGARKKK